MHDTSTSPLYQRWASRLIRLYPASWRERYADEMTQILEDSPPSLKTIFDLSLNLFDAYTHQSLIPGRIPTMLQKLRANELALYASAIFFFLAWIIERAHINQNQHMLFPDASISTISDSTLPILTRLLASDFNILLTLILIGGLPLLLATCWQALKERKLLLLLRCLLALVSPVLAVVLTEVTLLVTILLLHVPGISSPWVALIILVIYMGLSMAFIVSTIKRMEPSRHITHYALYVALVLTVAMLSGFVTLLVATVPTLVGISTAPSDKIAYTARHLLLLLVMVVTIGIAIKSLIHAFQTRQSTQTAA